MHESHPLFGPSATVLWLEDALSAALHDFASGEQWWSLRDAIKVAAAKELPGFRPWVKVGDTVYSPEDVQRAAAQIHAQDREDARRG